MRLALLKKMVMVLCVLLNAEAQSQEKDPGILSQDEERLENLAEREDMTKDDSWWQQWEYWRRHPLNLNIASENDLQELHLLTDVQVSNFLQYRKLLGKLIDIYELQAIPSWDIITISRVIPFVTISNEAELYEQFARRFRSGENQLLFRMATSASDTNNLGSPFALMCRYSYKYKNLLQFGITADKDAGEPFFNGGQRLGFDFYSFHFFARDLGKIKALAIGDFTVNMGQGLIQWGGFAFQKSAVVLEIQRQGPVLRPYSGTSEFNFHRGAGSTWQYHHTTVTLFFSSRKLDASLVTDSLHSDPYISSLITSGYHRTRTELADRHALQCVTAGGNISFQLKDLSFGMNVIQYYFSAPFENSGRPYDLFSMQGGNWRNISIDYSYNVRNLHLFGEAAVDKKMNAAVVNGMLISLDHGTSLALMHRQISRAYQSLFSNAFTENSAPVNENGWYGAISVSPAWGWKIDAYADLFRFPWLKYRVDQPSEGSDYLLQLTWLPSRQTEMYIRYRTGSKTIDLTSDDMQSDATVPLPKQSWRTQISFSFNRLFSMRSRMEFVSLHSPGTMLKEQGFLWLGDLHYKPYSNPFSFILRMVYFETDSYNSRIYAAENSGSNSFFIPAYFNKGIRYSIVLNSRVPYLINRKVQKKIDCRMALYIARSTTPGSTTESRLQLTLAYQ